MVLENCSNVDEAKDYLSDLEILKTAANMTFLDANGKGIVVGKYPEGQYSIESSKEPLICLNHVLNKLGHRVPLSPSYEHNRYRRV